MKGNDLFRILTENAEEEVWDGSCWGWVSSNFKTHPGLGDLGVDNDPNSGLARRGVIELRSYHGSFHNAVTGGLLLGSRG